MTDKLSSVDATFDRIDLSLREFRAEQLATRAELVSEMQTLRSSLDQFRDRMMLAGFSLATALVAVAAAVILKT